MPISAEDLETADDYRAALQRGLKEKPKGKFILAELVFKDGKKLRALLFGRRFDELKKHCSDKRQRMVALGTVDTADDGTVVFSPSTGTLTDKHLEDLKIGKLAKVAGKGKASDAEKFDLERVPGTSRTVRDVLADVRRGLSDSKGWKHPQMQQQASKLADQIEKLAGKQALKDIARPYETFEQLVVDAKLIPQAAAELKRLEPVVEALRKADPKQGAVAKKLFDETRDSFSRGNFVACNTNLTVLRRRLPGGPDYVPLEAKQGPVGAPLAPDYKARKAALEANIKKVLAERSDKYDQYKAECQRLDTFFKKQAKGDLHKKLVDIDSKPPGPDQRGLMTRALLVVQSYIQALTRGGAEASMSNEYLKMLRDTHAALKKRLSA